MALLTGSSTLGTAFTPAAGAFNITCLSGTGVDVQRDTGGGYTSAGKVPAGQNFDVTQTVASHTWRFLALDSVTTTVRADQ